MFHASTTVDRSVLFDGGLCLKRSQRAREPPLCRSTIKSYPDPPSLARELQEKTALQLRYNLNIRRDACLASVPDGALPTNRLDLDVSSSGKVSAKARPTEGASAFRAETLSGSAGGGSIGAGGGALTLRGRIASSASVVWVRNLESQRVFCQLIVASLVVRSMCCGVFRDQKSTRLWF